MKILTNLKKTETIFWLSLSLLLMTLSIGLTAREKKLDQANQKSILEATASVQEIDPQIYFSNLDLQARAYIVYDPEKKKIIASKNESDVLPLASITKMMTILTANKLATPQTGIIIDDYSLSQAGESGLELGETWQLKDLSDLTMVSSSNDGASAIANGISMLAGINFVNEMNKEAKNLGLASTTFTNETGLDLNLNSPGSEGTALDVAKLFAYVLKQYPELLEPTSKKTFSSTSLDERPHFVRNTNTAMGEIPGLLGGKTGYTDLAGGNLAVVANLGLRRPIIFVVLGSTGNGRFTEVKKLVSATQNYLIDQAKF